MRRRRDDTDHHADLLLVSGLTGHKPSTIRHWTMFVIDNAGDGFIHSSACFARHAGEAFVPVVADRLAALPPCRGRDG